MTTGPELPIDEISHDDIAWACDVMHLPKDAFAGPDGNDHRQKILRELGTIDVEACPGSGKTTLLVAKLAIIARKWQDKHRGVCVLSHTNVARQEIERLLGSTPAGRSLLNYPHFVGTIHNFADHFLALPFLRSRGNPLRHVDDARCEAHRRRLLEQDRFSGLRAWVDKNEENGGNVVGSWRVATPDYVVMKDDGKPSFKDASGTASQQLKKLAQCCVEDGYFRYSEMFTWAEALIGEQPAIRSALRARFPMVFIDEVQDNSEVQSTFLHRLFAEGNGASVRQRFGDSNQAIFNNDECPAALAFPDPLYRREIESSHRFGQELADLAAPIAVEPQALVGRGPSGARTTAATAGQHTIFLFNEETVARVLPTFADQLLDVFPENDRGKCDFVAVGAVHRPTSGNGFPRAVPDYFPDYDHGLTGGELRPERLLQYWGAGRRASEKSGESHYSVDRFAEGILRLARIMRPGGAHYGWRRRHRHILDSLMSDTDGQDTYRSMVRDLVTAESLPSAGEWATTWLPAIGRVIKGLTGALPSGDEASSFLAWSSSDMSEGADQAAPRRDNVFRYPAGDPKVEIRLGSIHSVKGETHTATLVLETYWHNRNLGSLKPWLLRQKVKKGEPRVRNKKRLKEHYVAMTRPSHLLCLAMHEDTFEKAEIDMLKGQAWRVVRLTKNGPEQL